MIRRVRPFAILGACAIALAASAADAPPVFTDVTAQAGVRFVHNSGAFGKKYLPETMGSGVVWFDADGDGWQDLLLVNATNWPGRSGPQSLPTLYRNNRAGAFVDMPVNDGEEPWSCVASAMPADRWVVSR